MAVSDKQGRVLAYSVILLSGVTVALLLGKDFAWDSLAYHVYAGFSALEPRFSADYFGASTQGYLNPYSHAPFYWMLKQGWAPQAITALLALFHSINLLIVYEAARFLGRHADGALDWKPVLLAVLLALLNPVFTLEIGTSFNEISTAVPLLLGWYVLLRHVETPSLGWVALAGVLIGAAAALKLTNVFYSVTALPMLLLAAAGARFKLLSVLVFAAGGILGTLACGGWWAWQLWQQFGNPFFPMFNQFFQSPDFATSTIKHYRFLPRGLGDALLAPFKMLQPASGVHIEPLAPDARYAVLAVLLVLFGLKWAARFTALRTWPQAAPFAPYQRQRALLALSLSLALAWMFWLLTSGNSRYFLPIAGLASVLLACLLARFSSRPRFFAYAGMALLAVQLYLTGVVADRRYEPAGWGQSWFELRIPPELERQSALYLNTGVLPGSFLLPFLAPGSSMISSGGQYPLALNGKISALLARHGQHVRVMLRTRSAAMPAPGEFAAALIALGLEADPATCLPIEFLQRHARPRADEIIYYISCKTRPLQWSAEQHARYDASKRRAARLFDALELLCPAYFQPRGLPIEGDGRRFSVYYMNTDIVLEQYANGKLAWRNAAHDQREIGHIDALERALPPKSAVCP